jgi:osmotically-inducible protein OsmY
LNARRYPDVRGYYQEQHWARDPRTGNLYGYEYSAPIGGRYSERDEALRGGRQGSWDESSTRSAGSEGWSLDARGPADRGRRWNPRSDQTGATNRLGSHYGKGPKGYVRSDERIREDVCDRLSDDDEVDASEISVSVKDGEVTLEGSVTDRHSKHRAEDIAESVSGVRDVTNRLRAKKSFIREIGDKLSGGDELEHRGHTGSGTRNSPSGVANRGAQSH